MRVGDPLPRPLVEVLPEYAGQACTVRGCAERARYQIAFLAVRHTRAGVRIMSRRWIRRCLPHARAVFTRSGLTWLEPRAAKGSGR